jgi:hypothetical protein
MQLIAEQALMPQAVGGPGAVAGAEPPKHAGIQSASASGLAELKAELTRLSAEKSTLAATASVRIAGLERDLAAAKAELAQVADQRDQALAAVPEPAANHELESLQDEYQALRAEYELINQELTDRHTDLQQLRSEKTAAQLAAAEEIAALKSALMRLTVDQLTTGENGVNRPADRQGGEPSAGPHSATNSAKPTEPPPAVQVMGDQMESDPSSFHLDTSLAAIPCKSTDEVIDLRVSLNTVRMNFDGANGKNCSAYICGLERDGSRQVYIALYQTEDKKALIYVPAQQPSGTAEYHRTMEGAVSFTDVVGFIINLEYLGGGAAARAKILQQIPVLARP